MVQDLCAPVSQIILGWATSTTRSGCLGKGRSGGGPWRGIRLPFPRFPRSVEACHSLPWPGTGKQGVWACPIFHLGEPRLREGKRLL